MQDCHHKRMAVDDTSVQPHLKLSLFSKFCIRTESVSAVCSGVPKKAGGGWGCQTLTLLRKRRMTKKQKSHGTVHMKCVTIFNCKLDIMAQWSCTIAKFKSIVCHCVHGQRFYQGFEFQNVLPLSQLNSWRCAKGKCG